MSTATVTSAPGWPSTVLQAQCRRCDWNGPRHDVREAFAGLDPFAKRERALVNAEAEAHVCDPTVLRLAATIRSQPGDPMIGGLEDVIRAVLAVQAADAPPGGKPDVRDGAHLNGRVTQ